MINVASMTFIS